MLDTFIKNRGVTKTIIHNNNHNQINEINWDADYDGEKANISLDMNNDGKEEHYNLQLSNSDLAKMLSLNSVNKSLDERLLRDFKGRKKQPMIAEIDCDEYDNLNKIILNNERILLNNKKELKREFNDDLLIDNKKITHISSPLQNEEFLIPLTIHKNSNSNSNSLNNNILKLTPRKRRKTHRVYKLRKPKISKRRKYTKRSTKKMPRSLQKYLLENNYSM